MEMMQDWKPKVSINDGLPFLKGLVEAATDNCYTVVHQENCKN